MDSVKLEVLFRLFSWAITIDFISGVLAAAKERRLKSRTCSDGLFRTLGEAIILFMFIGVSKLIPSTSVMLTSFTIGFIFKEGMSINENLTRLGVWIHPAIRKALAVGSENEEVISNEPNKTTNTK